MILAMIPARLGSQRLKQKNLRTLNGIPLITRAIRKCKAAGVFDEIWVNSEHTGFATIAAEENVLFHQRPAYLASNTATSEDYIYEFLKAHPCDIVIQVHSIAPLLGVDAVRSFVETMQISNYDVLLSCVLEQIECAMDGVPVNFSFEKKQNSQELSPIQRVTWSITGWRSSSYTTAYENKRCATYAGKVGFFPIDRLGGHIIKYEEDLEIAEYYISLMESK
ncbi:MAG: cytidyltransferase [Anaerolineae bacterium]|nr:cytidyltransferase [Anaerolineae bacterium]